MQHCVYSCKKEEVKQTKEGPHMLDKNQFQKPSIEYRPDIRWWLAEGFHTDATLKEEIASLHSAGFGGSAFDHFTDLRRQFAELYAGNKREHHRDDHGERHVHHRTGKSHEHFLPGRDAGPWNTLLRFGAFKRLGAFGVDIRDGDVPTERYGRNAIFHAAPLLFPERRPETDRKSLNLETELYRHKKMPELVNENGK
jgi:hypothetical protein